MDIQLDCKNVLITPNSGRFLSAELEGVLVSEILNSISIDDVVEHFGHADLLDKIGQQKVEQYFDLVPSEGE